jgi:hypothetical protein
MHPFRHRVLGLVVLLYPFKSDPHPDRGSLFFIAVLLKTSKFKLTHYPIFTELRNQRLEVSSTAVAPFPSSDCVGLPSVPRGFTRSPTLPCC